MKLLILAEEARYARYLPDMPITREVEAVYAPLEREPGALAALCPEAEVLCATSMTPIGRELMEKLPCLKLIHVEGVGFDRVDLSAATERGILVCNNPGCNAPGVAEHTLMLMLMLLHQAVPTHQGVLAGRQGALMDYYFYNTLPELEDCTVGLVGFGDIAQATANRLKAFGCKVYYNAPHRRPTEVEERCGASYLPLEELLGRCDIVSLHCPANDATHHLVNEGFLAAMKPGALLVNTARGQLIDDAALVAALERGHLAGAGLDAYQPEPLPAESPLMRASEAVKARLVLTPHSAGLTTASFLRAHRGLWGNIARLAAGEQPLTVVNRTKDAIL